MKKKRRFKIFLIIVAVILFIAFSVICIEKYLYRQAKEIKTNEVYMDRGNSIKDMYVYTDNRYYIELRDDGTYSILFDRTRDEEDETCIMSFVTGTYEKKDDVYILNPKEGGMVGLVTWPDELEVVEIARAEGDELLQPGYGWVYVITTNIYSDKEGAKILAVPKEKDPTDYYKDRGIETLYHADKDDLPDTVDDFLKEYEESKMG